MRWSVIRSLKQHRYSLGAVSCRSKPVSCHARRSLSQEAETRDWTAIAREAYERRKSSPVDLSRFPASHVRNFAVIAHIDAGKSTLSDRLLEWTGTISLQGGRNLQVLDKLNVERERGITVKANTASMIYEREDGSYLLNLIDTPGHVDFSSEVHRSLLACQGALLLVDATRGIQSQTLTVFNAAKNRANITAMIGVVNKVDLSHAEPDLAAEEVADLLQGKAEDVLRISAKNGIGIQQVLDAIVDGIPAPPHADPSKPFRALVFDSHFDSFRGVVSLIAVLDGKLSRDDKVRFQSIGQKKWDVADVGLLFPDPVSQPTLYAGHVGYLTCAMRDDADAKIGDICHAPGLDVSETTSFQPLAPVVFATFHPLVAGGFSALEEAVKLLILNDRSISCQKETSAALGQGLRLGFLGALHMDVVKQRLADEYEAAVIVTKPFVPLRALRADGSFHAIESPQEWPDTFDFSPSHPNAIKEVQEPMVQVVVSVPDSMTSPVMSLCVSCRARQTGYSFPPIAPVIVDGSSTPMAELTFLMPLSSLVTTFHSRLNSEAHGYATFSHSPAGFAGADLVKVVMTLQDDPIEPLSMILHRSNAPKEAKRKVERLAKVVDRGFVEVNIRASVEGRVIAKETIKPYRKNVLFGITTDRKARLLFRLGLEAHPSQRKHIEAQKKGLADHKQRSHISLAPAKYDLVLKDDYYGVSQPEPLKPKVEKQRPRKGGHKG